MSGGSWDYISFQLEDVADKLANAKQPERRALSRVVKDVADALHDIEWVDSGDYGEGDETKAIEKALGKKYKSLILSEVIQSAEAIKNELQEMIVKYSQKER